MSDRARSEHIGIYIQNERSIVYRHIKYNYFNTLIPSDTRMGDGIT